jgi:hypothetical protein
LVPASSFPKLLRKHWVVALLVAILVAETVFFAAVLLEMGSKGTQRFPAFTQLLALGPITLGFLEYTL